MSRLYNVHVGISMMVYADDKEHAKEIAALHFDEEAKLQEPEVDDFVATESCMRGKRCYAHGWEDGDIPYGQDPYHEKTVDQRFREEEKLP